MYKRQPLAGANTLRCGWGYRCCFLLSGLRVLLGARRTKWRAARINIGVGADREKEIWCPQFSYRSIFMYVFFYWPKILGRHVSSTGGRDDTFSGKKKENLTDWPWMMTSIILVFLSECLRSSFFRHTLHCTLPKKSIELSILL